MNFFKRALYSLRYHKKNSILTFGVFIILSTLILLGFSVSTACEQSVRDIRIKIGAEIQMTNSSLSSGEINGKNSIPLEKAKQIGSDSEVEKVDYSVVSAGIPVGFSPILLGEQSLENDKTPSLLIYGDTNTAKNRLFSRGSLELCSGRYPNEESPDEAVISQDLAKKNQLSDGDEIQLQSPYTDEKVTLKIVGFYRPLSQSSDGLAPYENLENVVFSGSEVALALNGNEYIEIVYFKITDPVSVDGVIERAQQLPQMGEFDQGITYIKNNGKYRDMEAALNSVVAVSSLMVWASVVMGTAILTLIIMIALRERDFEIGILLSLGESRKKIILQMMIEALIPVLLAITTSAIISVGLADSVGALTGIAGLKVQVGTYSLVLVYLCGLLLVLAASGVTIYKIIRYRPQKNLTAIR